MKERMIRVDTLFYHIGKIIWLPVLLAGSWFAQTGFENYSGYMACDIYRVTGFPCPGCGGTRAVYYLFCKDVLKSIRYHPAVLFGVIAYFHFMLLYFARKHIFKTIGQKEIRIEYYMYAFAGVILLQWGIKIAALFV